MEIEELVREQEEEQQYEQLQPYQLTRHYGSKSDTFERESLIDGFFGKFSRKNKSNFITKIYVYIYICPTKAQSS